MKILYKKATLKFYDIHKRQDFDYCRKQLEEFQLEKTINYIKVYNDFNFHIGYHFNFLIKSSSYKHLYEKYSKKETKKEGVFLWLQDINNMHELCDWVSYMSMRENVDFKNSLPNQRIRLTQHSPTPSLAPESPESNGETFYQMGHLTF